MKIAAIGRQPSFGRQLRNDELKQFEATLAEGKKAIGQTGHSIFIMPTQSLPQAPEKNTGIGHLTSKNEQEFVKYMHSMLGFNVMEDLPQGQIAHYHNNFYCNYQSTALALGDQMINPELLTTPEYANLLTEAEYNRIVSANTRDGKEKFANFPNVTEPNGAQNTALKKAFNRFEELPDTHPLKTEYNKFVKDNSEWIDFLYKDKGDFFKFKQFLAEKHLQKGHDFLHSMGVKSCGDCLIGATPDEVKAKPFAFNLDWNLGWHLPSTNFEKITDPTSDAHKYMEYKVKNFARRYDMIRFDVGWAYIQPRLFKNHDNSTIKKPYFGDEILKLIEKWVKEVKGDDFDLKNLIWEVEAGPEDFQWEKDGKMIEPLRNRMKIYSTMYMSDNWASNEAFLRRGFGEDNFVLGVGNHDHQPLHNLANNMGFPKKDQNGNVYQEFNKATSLEPLARILKLDKEFVNIPVEYAKAKRAEAMMAKHTMEFFMDDFGYQDRFDMHFENCDKTPTENYCYKILSDWKKQYHEAVETGYGANKMDSLEKIFKAKGLNEKFPDLYNRIVKFRDILYEKSTPKPTDTSSIAEESKSVTKNKYLIPFLAAGVAIVAGGAYLLKNRTQKETSAKPEVIENRASLVKTA